MRSRKRRREGKEDGKGRRTDMVALWGWFRNTYSSLYGHGNGYSTIACNPISTDAIYPIYHTLLSGALSTPAGARSLNARFNRVCATVVSLAFLPPTPINVFRTCPKSLDIRSACFNFLFTSRLKIF